MAEYDRKINKDYRKRAFPSTSPGSITIEATISITMFMMIVLYFVGLMTILSKEFSKQIFIDNISKRMSKAMFYVKIADQITDYNDTLKKEKEKIEQLAKESKEEGFSLTEQVVKDGEIDIKLEYALQLPIWRNIFLIKQRSKIKDWTGIDLCKENNIVYVTKTGSVYHTTRDCKYLDINISSDVYKNLSTLRNESGAKYSKCKYCVKETPKEWAKIYITSYGNKYHTNVSCSQLSRYIIEMEISQVGDRKVCSKCGG